MVRDIQQVMNVIDKLIEEESYEEAYKKYKSIDYSIDQMRLNIFLLSKDEKDMLSRLYSSYAYFLFGFGEYGQFFEMYIKAQKYGYSSEERRKFIYESFIEPNIEDLKKNYYKNMDNMKNKKCIQNFLEFDELPYWLITTGTEKEYYLYEKETDLIKERVSLEPQFIEVDERASDHIIMNKGCWSEAWLYIKNISEKRKKSYVITKDFKKLISYFQGYIVEDIYLDMFSIFENIASLKEHFTNSNDYLPRSFIGSDEDRIECDELIKEIHEHRLSSKGRQGENILLSICIPSFNRGKRAYKNVLHTLKSELDEEIEVILSNNGTQNETKEFYKKASEIKDPRFTYFEFDKNQDMALNICKLGELAQGKYILLLSDEDLIDLVQLRFLINTLSSKKDDIGIVRVNSNVQAKTPFIGMTRPGEDSLLTFMLTSNYISGSIYNKNLLDKYNIIEYIKENLENETCFYYPHMVIELILCQYGNALGLNTILINEGEAEKTDFAISDKAGQPTMPYYATIEGRLKQHEGFFEVIKNLEISKKDFNVLRQMYIKLSFKTIYLVNLSINAYYKKAGVNTGQLLQLAYEESLKYLEEIYEGRKGSNKHKYLMDLSELKRYYEYFKG